MDSDYKRDHELFVRNLNGTSSVEVFLASSITEISIAAVRAISFTISEESSRWWFYSLGQSLLISTPSILAVTVLNEHLIFLAFTLIVFAAAAIISRQILLRNNEVTAGPESHQITFISEFRSHLLLDTLISILAVDFPAYPRRFAKTETFGWGYMDVGVGMFVVAAGLVSYETRTTTKLKQWQNLWKTIFSSAALIVLGLLRVLVTWEVNYHEHITEYGAHWNFFLTLASTRVLCSFLLIIIPVQYSIHCSVIFICLYQFALSNLGLTDFVFGVERRNIFEANKEGICSLVGYISSYLAAVHLGRIIVKHTENKVRLFIYLLLGGVSFYFIMHLSCLYIQPVSRRIFNFSYFSWVISLSCFKLASHLASDAVLKGKAQCKVILAINKQGLLFFLAGNILTGFINLTIKTLSASMFETLAILTMYMIVSSTIVLAVYRYAAHSDCKKDK